MPQSVNGHKSLVTRIGDSTINPHLKLQDVLRVSGFSCNLLSVGKITKDLNCVVLFFDEFLCLSGPSNEEADWSG